MPTQVDNDPQLDTPPGEKNFIVPDEFRLPAGAALLAIFPRAHYLGHDLQAFATFPDGTRKSLINIPNWNLNWQAVYRYAAPVNLPAGTVISMRYSYDNADENALNPNDQAKPVTARHTSSDEMAH